MFILAFGLFARGNAVMRLGVVIAVAAGVFGVYQLSATRECSVGIVGHAAAITVRGWPLPGLFL